MSNKNIVQPAYNSFINSWNIPLNENFQNIDDSLGTVQAFNLASASGTVAVSATTFSGAYPANTPSYVPLIWSLTGTMTANVNLQLPSGINGQWIVNNATNGFTVTISSAGGGASLSMGAGVVSFYSDGTNIAVLSTALLPSGWSYRNKIINGEMSINQRGATSGTSVGYTCDRWFFTATQTTWGFWNLTGTPPAQFGGTLGWQSSGSHTPGVNDNLILQQRIEASYLSDSLWGTSSALSSTLTFWVAASATGTYGGSITNTAGTRSYPFTYAVSSANTWTPITVSIPGDTAGTWVLTGNGVGASVRFALGSGTNFTAPTANAWQSGNLVAPPGCVQVCATNSAYLNISGVQFELNPVATPFERRHPATEFSLCQRYWTEATTVLGGVSSSGIIAFWPITFPTSMRTAPSVNFNGSGGGGYSAVGADSVSPYGFAAAVTPNSGAFGVNYFWDANAEL